MTPKLNFAIENICNGHGDETRVPCDECSEKKSGGEKKIILDLCGGTGSWSKPYKEAGYDVFNLTLPERDVREFNLEHLNQMLHNGEITDFTRSKRIYGILAAPPCTMFSLARTKAKKQRDLKEGMECVRACLNIIWSCMEVKQDTKIKTLPLKFWALENPVGMLKWFLGKPAFVFDPWEFGDGYQKKTALWGKFNEPIKTNLCLNKIKYPKFGSDRGIKFRFNAKEKSITPSGFAKAFFEANR